MALKPPLTGIPRVDRALQDMVKKLGAATEVNITMIVTGGGGSGGGGGGEGIQPRAGVTVEVYVWDPDNPTSPPGGNKLGETTTDSLGSWVFDVAANGIVQPTPLTIMVAGVAKDVNPLIVSGPFWQQPGGSYYPYKIGDVELRLP